MAHIGYKFMYKKNIFYINLGKTISQQVVDQLLGCFCYNFTFDLKKEKKKANKKNTPKKNPTNQRNPKHPPKMFQYEGIKICK